MQCQNIRSVVDIKSEIVLLDLEDSTSKDFDILFKRKKQNI